MLKTWTNKFDYKKTFQKPFTAKKPKKQIKKNKLTNEQLLQKALKIARAKNRHRREDK